MSRNVNVIYVVFIFFEIFSAIQWRMRGKDSHNSKCSDSTPNKESWKFLLNSRDATSGSLVINEKDELLYPYYDNHQGCIGKININTGSEVGNICWKSGDIPRAGLISESFTDKYVFLEKADSLHVLNMGKMKLEEWKLIKDFSYYNNYVLYMDNVIYAERGMCKYQSYEVCLNVSSIKIGEEKVNWMIPNVNCSSEKCFLTIDNSENVFIIDDTSVYTSRRTNNVWKINANTGVYQRYPIVDGTYKQVSSRVAITNVERTQKSYFYIQKVFSIDNNPFYYLYAYAMHDDKMKWRQKIPIIVEKDSTDNLCGDISISNDGNILYFVCQYKGWDPKPSTMFYAINSKDGRIIFQKDFYDVNMNNCREISVLKNGKIIVWCKGVFTTKHYVLDKGSYDVVDEKDWGKAEAFLEAISDANNNVYVQLSYFMSDSFIVKFNVN